MAAPRTWILRAILTAIGVAAAAWPAAARACDMSDQATCSKQHGCMNLSDCSCKVCTIAGQVCLNNRCVHQCMSNTDCTGGDLCHDGVCKPPTCSSNADCTQSQVCSADGTCEAPIDPGPDPGCDCALGGREDPLPFAALLAACAAAALRRRSPRRAGAPTAPASGTRSHRPPRRCWAGNRGRRPRTPAS